jgi:integrase
MPREVRPRPRHGGWSFTYRKRTVWRKHEGNAWAELERLRGLYGDTSREPPPASVAELIERYTRTHPARHTSERLDDLDEFAGELACATLPVDLLTQFHAWLRSVRRSRQPGREGRKLSAETIRKDVVFASSCLRWGALRGWCPAMRDRPRLAKTAPRPKALTDAELAALWKKLTAKGAKARHALAVARFIVETGCRPGEARLLEWPEVDLARRVVTLASHKTAHATGEPRIFALTKTAAEIVAAQAGRHPRYVFTSHAGEPYTESGLGSIIAHHGVNIYRLRHTWCQRATEAGVPDSVILRQMGHTSSRMLTVYRRITDTQLAAAAGLCDGLSRLPQIPEQPPAGAAAKPDRGKHRRRGTANVRGAQKPKEAGPPAEPPPGPARERARASTAKPGQRPKPSRG